MASFGKTRLAVKDALDGQDDNAAMRRGLYAIATQLDRLESLITKGITLVISTSIALLLALATALLARIG